MKKIILFLCFLFSGILIYLTANYFFIYKTQKISINWNTFTLYIADNNFKIKKWLSIFKNIKKNQGMIFIFPDTNYYGFWMKNMKFDIDLLWINKNWKIVWYINNFKKETYPKIFFPAKKIKYVIELNNQAIEKYNIKTWNLIVQSK